MTRDEERAIEWECQKVLRRYYFHVDRCEYDKAVMLFTPNGDWYWFTMGVNLVGRKKILEGLRSGLGAGTFRHVMTNVVVTVIDKVHAESRAYNTVYSSPEICDDQHKGPIAFDGPTLTMDALDEFTRTDEG